MDREHRGYRPAGGVDPEVDVAARVLGGQQEQLRAEPVADVTPQWLKNTVEAMHDKLKFGEGALENMVRLSGKTQEYLTRATQRYYGKTPMQIINDIRINFAKKQLEITNYSVT
ncbi:hypothetical protein, partial [Roseibium denhamense]|uniref:hypothetical protein n=1 Tax=Roseibium denhamense TaxID=76305 RepID=UPI003CD05FBE